MKIGWNIRKLWHFEVSKICTKHFLTSRYEYMQMSELMMSSPHYLPYILYMKFWKCLYFAQTCDSMSLISRYIGVIIILHLLREELSKSNILIAEIWNFCHFCVQNEWKIMRRWHHQLTHLNIHIDWSRYICFLKICETSECHSFLIFQPVFVRFSLFCSNFFTLSSDIKLNLFWISSLIKESSLGLALGLHIGAWSLLAKVKRTLYSEKNMNSLNVEYFLAMNIQNLDKNG